MDPISKGDPQWRSTSVTWLEIMPCLTLRAWPDTPPFTPFSQVIMEWKMIEFWGFFYTVKKVIMSFKKVDIYNFSKISLGVLEILGQSRAKKWSPPLTKCSLFADPSPPWEGCPVWDNAPLSLKKLPFKINCQSPFKARMVENRLNYNFYMFLALQI